jgi:hypothetical protein
MNFSDGQKSQLLDDLTEVRFITDQFYNYLTGQSLDDALADILKEA